MNYQYQHLSIPQLEERVRNMKIDKNEDTHRLFTFIPFSLLVNGTVFEEESKLEKNANDFQGGFVRTFDLIDAEQPTALLKMMRALKKGQNLLVYVDGNTGVKSGAENQVIVNFMAGQLRVRKGIAVLAELMQCPIYPVSCLRTSLYAVRFSTANAIVPPKDKMQHPDFIQNTMQTLYKQLEKQLHGHLSQWECWLYLHQFMVLPTAVELPSTVGIQELMDPNVWGSFSIDDHCFAFSMKSFSSFKIAKSVYERMRRIVLDNG